VILLDDQHSQDNGVIMKESRLEKPVEDRRSLFRHQGSLEGEGKRSSRVDRPSQVLFSEGRTKSSGDFSTCTFRQRDSET
jgi:hypothetical protein